MSLANALLCALLVLCTIREKWTKPVSAFEIPASVHTSPALSEGPLLHSEGPSSTCPPQRSAMVSLLWGWGGERTAAWRPNILCFAVLTTRERDIEITQRPQRDLFSVCKCETEGLRDSSNACNCMCAFMCVCVPAGSKGVNPQTPKSWRGLILSFTLSLFSVVLCCLVVL